MISFETKEVQDYVCRIICVINLFVNMPHTKMYMLELNAVMENFFLLRKNSFSAYRKVGVHAQKCLLGMNKRMHHAQLSHACCLRPLFREGQNSKGKK